jgi:hypothetical protein
LFGIGCGGFALLLFFRRKRIHEKGIKINRNVMRIFHRSGVGAFGDIQPVSFYQYDNDIILVCVGKNDHFGHMHAGFDLRDKKR